MQPTGSVNYLNVEYFLRLLYEAALNPSSPTAFINQIVVFLTVLWILVTIIGFVLALGFLSWFIYNTLRLHQIREQEAPKFVTLDPVEAETTKDHNRWAHILALIESANQNDWRQAIIEADIMLDDLLTQIGLVGVGVGEKLKQADPHGFHTLNDAWEAHKVRNEIAHQGSAFPLTDHIAYRAIKHYENVFREHGEIQ